jgi:hypothetical protein
MNKNPSVKPQDSSPVAAGGDPHADFMRLSAQHNKLKGELAQDKATIAALVGAMEANTRMLLMVADLLKDGPHYTKASFVNEQIERNRAALASATKGGE